MRSGACRRMILDETDSTVVNDGSHPPGSHSSMARPFLTPLLWLSAACGIASVWIHVRATILREAVPEDLLWAVYAVLVTVWIPSVLLSDLLVVNRNRNNWLKTFLMTLGKAPGWVRYTVYVLGVYAIVSSWTRRPTLDDIGFQATVSLLGMFASFMSFAVYYVAANAQKD